MSYRNNPSSNSCIRVIWRNFSPNSSYIFSINFNGTYKVGKLVRLAARNNEILVKTKTIISKLFSCYVFKLIQLTVIVPQKIWKKNIESFHKYSSTAYSPGLVPNLHLSNSAKFALEQKLRNSTWKMSYFPHISCSESQFLQS